MLNKEKNAALPHDWLARALPEADRRAAFIERHRLGTVPYSMLGFPDFYEARRRDLLERLRTLLGVTEPAVAVASS